MTTPQFIATGGPDPSYVRQNLAAALPGYDGFIFAMPGSEALSFNFADLDDYLAQLSPGQGVRAEVNISGETSPDYMTINATYPKVTTAVVPFDPNAEADKIQATQNFVDHLDEIGALSRLQSLGVSVGSPTGEQFFWWHGADLQRYLALFPGKTVDDLAQMATDSFVRVCLALAAMLPAGAHLRMMILDPALLGPGAKDGGVWAAAYIEAGRDAVAAQFPAVQIVVVYQSFEESRPIPPSYAVIGAPLAYQAKEGAVVTNWPADATWGENHIRDVVKGLGNG